MRKFPSIRKVLDQAENVVLLFRGPVSDKKIMKEIVKLGELLHEFSISSHYWKHLARADERLAVKMEGVTLARKRIVEVIRKWEIEDRSIGQLIYEVSTMPIEAE